MNARDIFAESVFEEMQERREYSEQMENEKEEFLEEDSENENFDEMEKLAKDYLKSTYGVDEMPIINKEEEKKEGDASQEPVEAEVKEPADPVEEEPMYEKQEELWI